MNKAKLINSVLTGGGIGDRQHLNVIIGPSDKGYPKGYVLDANATKQLVGTGGGGSGTQEPSELEKIISVNKFNLTIGSANYSYNNIDVNNVNEQPYTNINMLGNSDRLSEYKNEQIGFGNINSGKLSYSGGNHNITLNAGVASNGTGSLLSSNYFVVDVVKHSDGPKLRLKSNVSGNINKLLKQKTLFITDKYAFSKQGSKYILKKIHNANVIFRDANSYTRIDNDTVEFDNVYLNKLKDYDRVFCYSAYNQSQSSILFGQFLGNNGNNNSIFVGSGLIGLQKPDGKYSPNLAIFGRYNSATNDGELACGIFNKSTSTANGDIQTIFSVGSGSDVDARKNTLEVAMFKQPDSTYKDKLYVNGVGGYNGSNVEDVSVKSIQEVITDLKNGQSEQLIKKGSVNDSIVSNFSSQNANADGDHSLSIGINTKASGEGSICLGRGGNASGRGAVCLGGYQIVSKQFKLIDKSSNMFRYTDSADIGYVYNLQDLTVYTDDGKYADVVRQYIGVEDNNDIRIQLSNNLGLNDNDVVRLNFTSSAIGDPSLSFGASTAKGYYGVALQQSNYTNRGFVCGAWNRAIGHSSFAAGQNNLAGSVGGVCFGVYNFTTNMHEAAFGRSNISRRGDNWWRAKNITDTAFYPADKWKVKTNDKKTIFTVGCGKDKMNRQNAFEVRADGDIYIIDNDDKSIPVQDRKMTRLQDALPNQRKGASEYDKVIKGISYEGYYEDKADKALMSAFVAAKNKGFNYIWAHIYKTTDDKLVVFNSVALNETFNNGTISGKNVRVESLTLEELQKFVNKNNEHIATLEDFCKLCKKGGIHPYLDFGDIETNGLNDIVKMLFDNGLINTTTLLSDNLERIKFIAKKANLQRSKLRLGWNYFGDIKGTELDDGITNIKEIRTACNDKLEVIMFAELYCCQLSENPEIDKLSNEFILLEGFGNYDKVDKMIKKCSMYTSAMAVNNIHPGQVVAES